MSYGVDLSSLLLSLWRIVRHMTSLRQMPLHSFKRLNLFREVTGCMSLHHMLFTYHCPNSSHRSKPLPPISRLDRDSQSRRCARLRRSVANSLNHAMTPYSQAFTALRELTKDIDLDKYYDIYDIRIQDVQQIAPEVHEVEYDDLESLKTLKSLLHRLHTTRKVFLCCLLAIDANGGYSDFGTWRTVVEQLKTLSTFMGEIGEALQRCAEEEESKLIFPLERQIVKLTYRPYRIQRPTHPHYKERRHIPSQGALAWTAPQTQFPFPGPQRPPSQDANSPRGVRPHTSGLSRRC